MQERSIIEFYFVFYFTENCVKEEQYFTIGGIYKGKEQYIGEYEFIGSDGDAGRAKNCILILFELIEWAHRKKLTSDQFDHFWPRQWRSRWPLERKKNKLWGLSNIYFVSTVKMDQKSNWTENVRNIFNIPQHGLRDQKTSPKMNLKKWTSHV